MKWTTISPTVLKAIKTQTDSNTTTIGQHTSQIAQNIEDIEHVEKSLQIGGTTYTSLANFNASLNVLLSSMSSDEVRQFGFGVSTAFGEFTVGSYVGTLYKVGTTNTSSHVSIKKIGAFDEIIGKKESNSWSWDSVALNSNMTSLVEPDTSSNRTIVTTLDNGTPYSNYGGCWYRKYGNHVHVHLGVQGLTANTPKKVFALPSGYRPYNSHIAFGVGGASYTAIARIEVQSGGDVFITSDDAYCQADFEFVVAG